MPFAGCEQMLALALRIRRVLAAIGCSQMTASGARDLATWDTETNNMECMCTSIS